MTRQTVRIHSNSLGQLHYVGPDVVARSQALATTNGLTVQRVAETVRTIYHLQQCITSYCLASHPANISSLDQRLRCSRKRIPRGNSRIDVKTEDLFNDPERSTYQRAAYPNMKSNLASIGLPRIVYWKRLLLNQFEDLYIVSPESTPSNSPEGSQYSSPVNSFGRENQDATPTKHT